MQVFNVRIFCIFKSLHLLAEANSIRLYENSNLFILSNFINGMFKKFLFPFSKLRAGQEDLIMSIYDAIEKKKNIIIHAPTGIGKTAAVLSPALTYALKNNLTIFFLTSRHTQHKIAVDTLNYIKDEFNQKIIAVDLIGKRWMCSLKGADRLSSAEFTDFCKMQREEGTCEHYNNLIQKNKLTVKGKEILSKIKDRLPLDVEDVIKLSSKENVCPYELSMILANKANVIIADYFYLFNPMISSLFFKKSKKEMDKSIIIIDEAHNLGKRIRDLLTIKMSNWIIKYAIKEAKKFHKKELIKKVVLIEDVLVRIGADLKCWQEKLVTKKEFISMIEKEFDYDELIAELEFAAEEVLHEQKKSFLGSIATFLTDWTGQDEGFTRILSFKEIKGQAHFSLSYRCLDPSLVSKPVIECAHSVIAMSGTLTPTTMYKDILGFNNSEEKSYTNPFPIKNRLSLIVPKTTTKYALRSEEQYKNIAKILSEIVTVVPGNSALFFPSYGLRNNINKYFSKFCLRHTLLEEPGMTKKEKAELLKEFKDHKDEGAVLSGVITGSFAEGIDLPGDFLKAVVVVGLPLEPPDLETKELINYYDKKFGKGWDYAYVLPAFIKAMQATGRCIRSERDKGAIIFLDERYRWKNYLRCFPPDFDVKICENYKEKIKDFFQYDWGTIFR